MVNEYVTKITLHALFTASLHKNMKAHTACNFNGLIATEGLRKVTGSHVHCTCGNISETVQMESLLLQTTNRK